MSETTTTTVNIETLEAVLEALTNMDTAWEHLTCREADALARLVAETGKVEDAAQALVFHVEDDDAGDAHAEIKYSDVEGWIERDDRDDLLGAALLYVAELVA